MTDAAQWEVALARFEGKLDAALSQQIRHEDRLNGHSKKIDQLQTQVTQVESRQQSYYAERKLRPNWATVVSAVVAAVMAVLLIAQQIWVS